MTNNPAEAGFTFLENIAPIIDILDGYRSQLLAHGYSETAAELMVVEMHAKILREV